MPDVIVEQMGLLYLQRAKTDIEREAGQAYSAGLTPNSACPYPFHSKCGRHWLAAYNLSIPLQKRSRNAAQESPIPR